MKSSTKQSDVTIGLDLGDRRTQSVVLDGAGEIIERRSIATTRAAMGRAFGEYRGSLMVMEVGTHSPWVSRLLRSRGFRVVTANPRQIRLISQSRGKTDRFDAQILARLGRADPALLAPVSHRGEEAQKHRALLQSPAGLVRSRVLLVNQVRGIAKALGVPLPKCSGSVFRRRVRETVGDESFPGLATLLDVIGQITVELQEPDQRVTQLCRTR